MDFFQKYKSIGSFPSRVTLSPHVTSDAFPVNRLYNDGIHLCETTHFVLASINQIPYRSRFLFHSSVEYLYDSILSTSPSLFDNPLRGFLIPEFSMEFSTLPCAFWYDCFQQASFLSSYSKSQLQFCSKWGMCTKKNVGSEWVHL